jgi:hypothetical protein
MIPTKVSENRRTSLLGWPSPSPEPLFRARRLRTPRCPSHTRQVASRDDAEVTTQTHMNERASHFASSLLGAGCGSSSLFLPLWVQRPLVHSLCVGVISSLFSKAFRSLTTLVCSLLDPSALFDHRRDQTNPTLISPPRVSLIIPLRVSGAHAH